MPSLSLRNMVTVRRFSRVVLLAGFLSSAPILTLLTTFCLAHRPEQVHLTVGYDPVNTRIVQWAALDEQDVSPYPVFVVYGKDKNAVERYNASTTVGSSILEAAGSSPDEERLVVALGKKHTATSKKSKVSDDFVFATHSDTLAKIAVRQARSFVFHVQEWGESGDPTTWAGYKDFETFNIARNYTMHVADIALRDLVQEKKTSNTTFSDFVYYKVGRSTDPGGGCRPATEMSTAPTLLLSQIANFVTGKKKAAAQRNNYQDTCWSKTFKFKTSLPDASLLSTSAPDSPRAARDAPRSELHEESKNTQKSSMASAPIQPGVETNGEMTSSDRAAILPSPHTFAVYGDMGDYNGQSRPMILQHQKDTNYNLTALLHVGDFAYDFESDSGLNGDLYMRDMEEIVAELPYLTVPGNHEDHYYYNHYYHRFLNQPTPPIERKLHNFEHFSKYHAQVAPGGRSTITDTKARGGSPGTAGREHHQDQEQREDLYQNFWYSVGFPNVGKFVFFTSEFYMKYNLDDALVRHLRELQYAWLENELKRTDREQFPWLVLASHHPLYCSAGPRTVGDCGDEAHTIRTGVAQYRVADESSTTVHLDAAMLKEDVARHAQAPVVGNKHYGEKLSGSLDQLFYETGVDLFLAGHVHNYERMFDVKPAENNDPTGVNNWNSGVTERKTVNPRATTHIVTGAAGNVEDHQPFNGGETNRTAFRSENYGWSLFTIWNKTHLHWQQIMTDNSEPVEDMGKVIDDFWLVQEKHGSFAGRDDELFGDGASHGHHKSALVENSAASSEFGRTASRSDSFLPSGVRRPGSSSSEEHDLQPLLAKDKAKTALSLQHDKQADEQAHDTTTTAREEGHERNDATDSVADQKPSTSTTKIKARQSGGGGAREDYTPERISEGATRDSDRASPSNQGFAVLVTDHSTSERAEPQNPAELHERRRQESEAQRLEKVHRFGSWQATRMEALALLEAEKKDEPSGDHAPSTPAVASSSSSAGTMRKRSYAEPEKRFYKPKVHDIEMEDKDSPVFFYV
ncbi:unnamed protein product [Amoebophrya sp. A120]|nr:unnamed protein product [Amoebophrya sp. A120]|eukprot:GSA120T00006167001.1